MESFSQSPPISAKRAEIEKAQAQVAVIDSQLADTIASSPIDGIVLSKSADLGEESGNREGTSAGCCHRFSAGGYHRIFSNRWNRSLKVRRSRRRERKSRRHKRRWLS